MKIWEIAFTIAGIGAIASFVFWSLSRQWLRLPIFQPLTKAQLFRLFVLFLILTFLFAISGVAAHVLLTRREHSVALIREAQSRAEFVELLKSREANFQAAFKECVDALEGISVAASRDGEDEAFLVALYYKQVEKRVCEINRQRINAVETGQWALLHEFDRQLEQVRAEFEEKRRQWNRQLSEEMWAQKALATMSPVLDTAQARRLFTTSQTAANILNETLKRDPSHSLQAMVNPKVTLPKTFGHR